jgi:hypothetical protein
MADRIPREDAKGSMHLAQVLSGVHEHDSVRSVHAFRINGRREGRTGENEAGCGPSGARAMADSKNAWMLEERWPCETQYA